MHSKAWRTLPAAFLGAAFLVALGAGPSLAAREFPSPWTAAQVDSLRAAHAGAHALVLLSQANISVAFDSRANCLRGELTRFSDVIILDNVQLAEQGTVVVVDSPLLELKDFTATVIPRGRGEPERHSRGSLDWSAFAPRGAGTYSLDEEISYASVPGLHSGDRLQTVATYRFTGHHGLLPETMAGGLAPTARCRYEVLLPRGYDLAWTAQGDSSLLGRLGKGVDEGDDGTRHAWQLDDLPPAPRDADAAASRGRVTVIPHVSRADVAPATGTFAVGPDWASIAIGYRARVVEAVAPTPEITDLARRATADCATDFARIDALYGWVQANTRYLGLYKGLSGIIPEPADKVLRDGYGDCKGLGVLLIALLRSVDIEAWPVLVRTGHLGPLAEDVPNPIQFNHFIVWANDGGDGLWLDATLEGCPAGVIYPQDAASPVLSTRPRHEGLATIPPASWSSGSLQYAVSGEITAGRSLRVAIELAADGIAGVMLRDLGAHRTDAELAELRRRWLCPATLAMGAVGGATDAGATSHDKVAWRLDANTSRPLPGNGGATFLPRTLPGLPGLTPELRPEALQDRDEEWTIGLPASWQVQPDSMQVASGPVSWERRVWQDGQALKLTRRIRWDRPALLGMSPAARRALWDGALMRIREDERGFITINGSKY